MKTRVQNAPSRLTFSDRLNTHFRNFVRSLPEEKCIPPGNSREILDQLEKNAPSDLEIILSYGTYNTQRASSFGHNPLGHIAIRIDNQVHTLNGLALLGEDENLILSCPLEDYLYGTKKPTANSFRGDSFGNSYIQNAISLRVRVLDSERKQKMLHEIFRMNSEFHRGNLRYSYTSFNCANFVDSILRAGGIQVFSNTQRLCFHILPLPLDLFAAILKINLKGLIDQTEMTLVFYPQIQQGPRLITGFRFPISIFHPRLMFETLWQQYTSRPETNRSSLELKRNFYEKQVAIGLTYHEPTNALKIDLPS